MKRSIKSYDILGHMHESTARFKLLVSLGDIQLAFEIDAHYVIYPAMPDLGLTEDTVDVKKVVAVQPAYQAYLDLFPLGSCLFSSIELEIFLLLANKDYGPEPPESGMSFVEVHLPSFAETAQKDRGRQGNQYVK